MYFVSITRIECVLCFKDISQCDRLMDSRLDLDFESMIAEEVEQMLKLQGDY